MTNKRIKSVAAEQEEIEVQEELTEDEAYIHYDITTYPSDFTLQVLYDKWKGNEITIPGFQRKYVWDQNRASLLIESFLLGLPVPNIFFFIDKENNKSVVIDGQQRLLSIFYYFDGFFGEEDEKGKKTVFKLTGLKVDNPFAGKTYTDIKGTSDGIKLRDSVLRAMNILQLAPRKDNTAIYHIFERLNTGGISLTPQEVRNCVFRGEFNDKLFKLNEDKNWRNILGKQKPDIHYKDMELILRVIALSQKHNEYESPMKEFLNKFMADHKNPSEEWLRNVSEQFERTAALIVNKLGENPFRRHGPINTSILDSVFSVLMENYQTIPEDLSTRHDTLIKSDVFVSYGTNATVAVKNRFEKVKTILMT